MGRNRLYSWSLAAFLFGIGAHSIRVWMRMPVWTWVLVALACVAALALARRSRVAFIGAILLSAFLLGVWRFDIVPFSDIQRLNQFHKPSQSVGALAWLGASRLQLTRRIERMFPRDEATLATGILYGEQNLSRDQRALMQRSGLMHIVAVSGSNVTIVVVVLMSAILAAGFHRRHAFWIASVGILAFLGFVGFSASVVRAGIMGWLVLLARRVGRIPTPSRLLLVAASVMTFLTPTLLAFDRGFALSFLATWGLLAWSPIFSRAYSKLPERFSIREAAATTSAATLMTAPYLGWAFGRMSLAGLFTNLLALPLVPWIMLWTAFAATWGDLPGSFLVRLPTLGLLRLLEWVARLADLVPWLNLRVPSVDIMSLIAIYILLWKIWRSCSEKNELSTE